VLDTWPPKWCGPNAVGQDEATIQKQKAEAKCLAQQKWNEQHVAEVRVAWEVAQASIGKAPVRGATTTEDESGPNVTTDPGTDTRT